ncbi:MAG TPA: hypothetical protein VFE48_25570 [Methylomirabilota bacterium]|nr:hypothetical protein [Methylomirabilota bacterium]
MAERTPPVDGAPPSAETRVELPALGVTLVGRHDPSGERWAAILDVLLGVAPAAPADESPEVA